MHILGIETSCDETSAAVVCDGHTVLSNVVFSQAHLHSPHGGVVPEIASRNHVESLPGVVEEAMQVSGVGWEAIDAVAATYGPGLASSLLVGLSAAKGLALRLGKPLIAVNHLEGHIRAAFLEQPSVAEEDAWPFIALVISGGHTSLIRVEGRGRYVLLGQTIDDAAGEAFDKGAKLLGLGYPGGPAIDKAARGIDPSMVRFPQGTLRRHKESAMGLDPELCFSFSGVKTALLYYLKDHPTGGDPERIARVAASYQEAIVAAIVKRCERAMRGHRWLVVGGGVSLNRMLRERLAKLAAKRGFKLLLAEPRFCADNAAMIAGVAGVGLGVRGDAAMAIDAEPNLEIGVGPARGY